MPVLHAKLPASAAERWTACPGSTHIEAPVERKRSEYADEGTAAHAVAESILQGIGTSNDFLGMFVYVDDDGGTEIRGETKPDKPGNWDSFLISNEMLQYVQVFTDFCGSASMIFGDGKKSRVLVEEYVKLAKVHKKLGGTLDYAEIFKSGEAVVVDLKYGRGIVVEVHDNMQQKIYALGLALKYKSIKTIHSYIVQPRAYHPDGPIRGTMYCAENLRTEFADWLYERALDTEDKSAPRASGSHCRWCDGLSVCPEVFKETIATAAEDFGDLDMADEPGVGAKLANAFELLPQIKAWVKSVETTALTYLSDGKPMPGFKLANGRPSRKWAADEADVVARVRGKVKKADCFKHTLLTPNQMEKQIGLKMKPAKAKKLVVDLIYLRPGGPKVVTADDPREDFATSAAEDFA